MQNPAPTTCKRKLLTRSCRLLRVISQAQPAGPDGAGGPYPLLCPPSSSMSKSSCSGLSSWRSATASTTTLSRISEMQATLKPCACQRPGTRYSRVAPSLPRIAVPSSCKCQPSDAQKWTRRGGGFRSPWIAEALARSSSPTKQNLQRQHIIKRKTRKCI